MSTTYNGSPTATQAPASPPAPGGVPELVLPADGDPANAASIAQALKVLADYEAWLFSPRATGSQWAEAVRRYRNALLQTRFGIDHLGMPAGLLSQFYEDWGSNAWSLSPGPAGPAIDGRWSGQTIGAATMIPRRALTAVNFNTNSIEIGLATAATNAGIILHKTSHLLLADLHDVVIEWDFQFASTSPQEIAFGLWDYAPILGAVGTTTVEAVAAAGAGMLYRAADTSQWFLYTKPIGGSVTITPAGGAPAPNTKHRGRLEIRGSATADGSASRVLLYMDGSLLANVVATMTGVEICAAFKAQATQTNLIHLGHVRFCANRWDGDNLI